VEKTRRILAVEDDPDGQVVVAHILNYLGIPVDVAGDAEQAAELLFHSGTIYRAAILDLALPGKDGWKLLAEIKENPATRALPCIAITAYHTPRLRSEALRAGFSGYFAKPIDAVLFVQQLKTVL
jgi:CheY-like chemotaxis protein